jgi:hypothetical protein
LFLKTAIQKFAVLARESGPGADEEILIRKTNCLSTAKAGRVFVFPKFLNQLKQISDRP